MKRKIKFVSPRVTRALPLFPETDLLLAASVDDYMKFTSTGMEENVVDASGSDDSAITVDLY